MKFNEINISKLIEKIKSQESTSKKELKLKYGYRIDLSKKELIVAKEINSLYERTVWGTIDDADNRSLSEEEYRIINQWIKGSIFGKDVLEVGCGSGRFTFHLAKEAEKVTALDREKETLLALKGKMPEKFHNKIDLLCLDFSKKNKLKKKYTSVFMIENLLGMNPRFEERKQIILNAEKSILNGGLLFVGFRVHPKAGNGYFYQSMPYNETVGIAINWSVRQLIHEFLTTTKNLEHMITIKGSNRPAGGKMYIAVFKKK